MNQGMLSRSWSRDTKPGVVVLEVRGRRQYEQHDKAAQQGQGVL